MEKVTKACESSSPRRAPSKWFWMSKIALNACLSRKGAQQPKQGFGFMYLERRYIDLASKRYDNKCGIPSAVRGLLEKDCVLNISCLTAEMGYVVVS